MYKQFGSGSGGNIHEKEIDYDRGMPEKGKVAFPAGCDMSEKLRKLESRRLYFLKMAGSDELRRTYIYCQESKLVRIVLEHVNKNEYGDCVKRVLELVKMQRLVRRTMDGDAFAIDAIPDNHARSFSDDWLPSWVVLKASLLAEWSERVNAGNKTKENKGVLPVAMGGVKAVTCYGCGLEGHKKGDPSCKAGKFDVHVSAPKDYRERMEKGRKREAEKKQNPKSPGANNRKGEDKGKKHCHAFNFGKGNCRYGAKCRYLHEKGEGGGKMKGFTPEQQKLVSTLLSSAMKRTASAIAKKNKKAKKKLKATKDKDGSESEGEDFSAMLASCLLAPIRNSIRRDLRTKDLVVMAANLHSVHKNCGIDSDAGVSISTLRADFI